LIREPRPTETVPERRGKSAASARLVGADHIGLGTDYPFPWTNTPVDHLMATPGLSDADRTAILGGTMSKLLRIGT